jgi:hypothetical protein
MNFPMPDFGTLYDYNTAEEIGPATEEQMLRSLAAARIDNGRGVIQGPAHIRYAHDGTLYYAERLCWVGDIPPEQSHRNREEELYAPVPARCGNCGRITSMHDDAACEEVARIQGLAP